MPISLIIKNDIGILIAITEDESERIECLKNLMGSFRIILVTA